MAAVALNTFKTIRTGITTSNVGIYTCPSGVASIVLLMNVTNIGSGTTTYNVTASHSRSAESPSDYLISNAFDVPANDSANLVPDGRLVLESGDVIKIKANENNVLNIVLSILETAKG
jgi:hypothetical protein